MTTTHTHTVRLILANGAQYHEQIRAASPNVAPVELAKAKGYAKSDIYVAHVNGVKVEIR
jgi:hypothetical protein